MKRGKGGRGRGQQATSRGQPGTSSGSQPGTSSGSQPVTSSGSQPGTSSGSQPVTSSGSQPGTSSRSQPGRSSGRRQGTSKRDQKQHYPAEYERYKKLFEQNVQNHKNKIDETLQHLNDKMKKVKTTPDHDEEMKEKVTIFTEWCTEYASHHWPHLGKVAYTVPPYFINKYKDDLSVFLGSELRGDEAQRQVANAFRLLNNEFERECSKDKSGKSPTMFIIVGYHYERFLLWLQVTGFRLLGAATTKLSAVFPHIKRPSGKKKKETVNAEEMYFKVPKSPGSTTRKGQRHEVDTFVLHPVKGAIFVQVKAVTPDAVCDIKTRIKKIKEVIEQLRHDEAAFREVMGHHENIKNVTTLVVGLPNLTHQDVEQAEEQCPDLTQRPANMVFLCKEDMYTSDIATAESDINLSSFRAFWDRLEDRIPASQRAVLPTWILDTVARYVGVLSSPSEYAEKTEHDHVRDVSDCVRLTGRLVKRLITTEEQRALLEAENKKLVHVCGPPGTGKTLLLIRKGQLFAKKQDHLVIVLNMYRGAQGRPVGQHIYDAICNGEPGKKGTVHHLKIDVDTIMDSQMLKQLVDDNLDKRKLLVLIDQPLPVEQYWKTIIESLRTDFTGSSIWCASGLNEVSLEMFERVELSIVYRIPPSVQHVLYNVDTGTRRRLYKADSNRQGEVALNGPTPVSVRHVLHQNKGVVMDCQQCAEELAQLLTVTFKVTALPDAPVVLSEPSAPHPSTIAVLFNLPQEECNTSPEELQPIQTTSTSFDTYLNKFESSKIVAELKKVAQAQVHIVKDPNDHNLNVGKHILVSWSDIVQGLEWDIVVFVPSGQAYREPAPEFTKTATGTGEAIPESEKIKDSSKPESEKSKEKPTPPTSSERGRPTGAGKTSPQPRTRKRNRSPESGLAHKYWRGDDLQRYSDWDRNGLVSAASTCTAQLVLMVP